MGSRLPRYMDRGRKAGKSPVAGVDRPRSFVLEADWERAEELRTERLGPSEQDIRADPERPSATLD